MEIEVFGEIALDSLLDSLKVLGFAFVIYFILSFFEGKIASLLERRKKAAPLFGSFVGVVPQCGISVVAGDLYTKDHITLGTLVAVFIACSDEALPIMFGNFEGKWPMAFAVIGLKIVFGAFFGYMVDLFYRKRHAVVDEHLEHCEGNHDIHKGCCGHEVEEGGKESPLHEHLIHPLVHSLKIFVYAFLISFLFGIFFEWLGTVINMEEFLSSSYWFSPIFAALVGLIPNCASSVLIAQLYVSGTIPFGALLAGLAVNAGLGPLYLFKQKKTIKSAFIIEGLLLVFGLIMGYAFMWVNV
ncbi:MAG: arsenic efflux protein [Bacilli bacterium]|nr:arsenic efflux protein [Bacilli bacterium]